MSGMKKAEMHIKEVMEKTGWSRGKAIDQMESAKIKVGISYKDYNKCNFHQFAEEEQEEAYRKILERRELRRQRKEHCIAFTMEKTGWSYEEADAKIKDARKRLGLTYKEYERFRMFQVPEENQLTVYKRKVKNAQRKKREKEIQENALMKVMEITGWSREEADARMARAMEEAGSSYEHYLIYRFWELTEEEQKTYFTKRDAVVLREKYTNNPEVKRLFQFKDRFNTYFHEYIGRAWMKTERMVLEEFEEKFKDQEKIMYKPLDSSGGNGIEVFHLKDEAMEDIYKKLVSLPEGIVEQYVIQHHEMQKLSLKSVNTIRIVTIRTSEEIEGVEKNKVNFVYAGVRMGQGDSYVDNLHSGGMIAILDLETGKIMTNGANHENRVYETHPDTGTVIKGFTIPFFEEAKAMIEVAGKDLDGFIGWDVAITEEGPILIEANGSPGADGLQIPFVPERKGVRYMIEKYL